MRIYWQLFTTFFRIGAFTFGGGYAMIPLIEKEIVTNKKWIKEEEILDYFAISQSIPGAIAINTSTLVGYKLAGKRGALCASIGIILPSLIIISLIAMFFTGISQQPLVRAIFSGINAGVILLIVLAGVKIFKAAVVDRLSLGIFLLSLAVMMFTKLSPIIVIIAGGLIGWLSYRLTQTKD